jgi:hypothetical protein
MEYSGRSLTAAAAPVALTAGAGVAAAVASTAAGSKRPGRSGRGGRCRGGERRQRQEASVGVAGEPRHRCAAAAATRVSRERNTR